MTSAERPGAGRRATHDSEAAAADYLGGGLRPRASRAFEHHLLGCERCWQEVDDGRVGRRLAESARQVAPPELREQLRAIIASEVSASEVSADASRAGRFTSGDPFRPSWRGPDQRSWGRLAALRAGHLTRITAGGGLALAGLALLVVVAAHPSRSDSPRQPAAISAAVADFRALRLPGTEVPRAAAPDLSQVRLRPMGAAAGVVAGRAVTGYAYRDSAGRDLLIYLSQEPFPTAPGAERLGGPDGPWIAGARGVTVLCARSPHAVLVLGLDRRLVLEVARTLNVT